MIIYECTKYDNWAQVIIIAKAAEVIECYRNAAHTNFPKRCNPTQSKNFMGE